MSITHDMGELFCKSMRPYGYRMIWLFWLPPRMTISHSTMNYRKVMTKLNENNVTFVIQAISSMNYFDSSTGPCHYPGKYTINV